MQLSGKRRGCLLEVEYALAPRHFNVVATVRHSRDFDACHQLLSSIKSKNSKTGISDNWNTSTYIHDIHIDIHGT